MTTRTRYISGYQFIWAGAIQPERDADGSLREFMPQERYSKSGSTRLNRHGIGPFCRFRLRGLSETAGVYVLTVNDKVKYVGRAQNFAERWGSRGYGTISPRNCYHGGQPTNCKVNNRILLSRSVGARIDLWFHQTEDLGCTEAKLISALAPAWNGNAPAKYKSE